MVKTFCAPGGVSSRPCAISPVWWETVQQNSLPDVEAVMSAGEYSSMSGEDFPPC